MNKQELYRRTIEKFGEINQIKKVDEELRELIFEINGILHTDRLFEYDGVVMFDQNIFSEIADVRIMLEQLELILSRYDEEASSKIAEQKEYKLNRLAKLIKE